LEATLVGILYVLLALKLYHNFCLQNEAIEMAQGAGVSSGYDKPDVDKEEG